MTLAPAVSATAAFFAIRRYAAWQPAAFVGGLCYGFGPFVATDLRFGHLNLTFLAIPPLILLALDDLFVRRSRPAPAVGAVLGGLVVVQFFVSTELLAVSAIVAFVGLVVLAVSSPRRALPALRAAAPGLLVGFVIASAVLAYPAWFAVAGPRHITGPVFPDIGNLTSTLAASVVRSSPPVSPSSSTSSPACRWRSSSTACTRETSERSPARDCAARPRRWPGHARPCQCPDPGLGGSHSPAGW